MNEKIKVILNQTKFERLADWANIGPVQRATLEEFTESIVKECELVIADQLKRDGESNDEWDRGYISGMWAATRYIKEHFEVEEQFTLICPKCGVDRIKEGCPGTSNCPVVGTAHKSLDI